MAEWIKGGAQIEIRIIHTRRGSALILPEVYQELHPLRVLLVLEELGTYSAWQIRE
jgi:hypothetical protein